MHISWREECSCTGLVRPGRAITTVVDLAEEAEEYIASNAQDRYNSIFLFQREECITARKS